MIKVSYLDLSVFSRGIIIMVHASKLVYKCTIKGDLKACCDKIVDFFGVEPVYTVTDDCPMSRLCRDYLNARGVTPQVLETCDDVEVEVSNTED